jgi:MFS family permease
MSGPSTPADEPVNTLQLGLGANRGQFWLLVLVNAFVGAMVGLERTVLPLIAEVEFGIASKTAALSFIATFGVVKALTNFFAGRLGDRHGRRRVLLAGWLFGIPVPLLVMWAPTWSWIVFANVLLGINQGLAWSTTVIMKVDLVGPRQRGLAMGLNESAGYLAVALSALGTGYIAEAHGLRPEPFYLGIAFAAAGLALSHLFVRETRHHVALEEERFPAHSTAGEYGAEPSEGAAPSGRAAPAERAVPSERPAMSGREIFARASWKDPALSSASHAGMVNNLNDGLAWGLFPLFFAAAGLNVSQIGVLSFTYPAVWGVLQLGTGALSDRWGRKGLIAGGMLVQSAALATIALVRGFWPWVGAAALLGAGTAMVYPTLLAAIGDVAHPRWRGSAIGIYRLWRDSGYAVGALLAGALADLFGMAWAIGGVALLTFGSGLAVLWRMPETMRGAPTSRPAAVAR